MLYMPVIVLFYQENGLSLKDVFLLQGIYSVAVVLLEIPSGYFADVWGRKNTMVIGSILGTLGFVIYSFSYGFSGFLIAELTLGIAQSFISGSDSALLYDSLLSENKENEYIKMEGRVISLGNFADTFAAIGGGFLAEISLRTPFIGQIFIAAMAIPASITLIEPVMGITRKAKLGEIMQIVKFSLFDNKILRSNIIFSSVIGASTLTFAWFVQPYLQFAGFQPSEIGIWWALLNLTVAISTLFAYRIEKRLGKNLTIILITVIISLGYIITGISGTVFSIAAMFIFYFIRGLATPVLKDYINRLVSSNVRATVLSVRNFIIRFFFALIGPFVGWYSDKFNLQNALLLSGIIFFVLSLVTIIGLMKAEKSILKY